MTINIEHLTVGEIEEAEKKYKESQENRDKLFDQHIVDIRNEAIHNRLERAMDLFRPQYLEMARNFIKIQPLYYDKSSIWWGWSDEGSCWQMIDEIDILILLQKKNIKKDDFPVLKKENIINSLKIIAREEMPGEMPVNLLQFKGDIVDINTGEITRATPKLFCTNPIPWNIGDDENTPIIDKMITEWVGEKYLQSVYEIIAYCCYRNYPIHLCFAFVGSGRNGKSSLQKLIHTFVGMNNICSLDFDRLTNPNNRFETSKAYKKLIASISETNFGSIDNSTQFKKITGQDPMDYEFKNKNPFTDMNYAKVLINSNGLPTTEDQSEGFYRRWFILDFANNFPEGKEITETIPKKEYENLARKIIRILPKLLEKGTFTNQGTIEERRLKYLEASNPLTIFLKQHCIVAFDKKSRYNELYNNYVRWLLQKKKRIVKRKEFKNSLEQEGFVVDRTWYNNENGMFVYGIDIKPTIIALSATQQNDTCDDGKNHLLVVDDFLSKTSVLETIRGLGDASVDDVLRFYPGEEEKVSSWIDTMIHDGEIFRITNGRLKVLE